MSTFCFAGVQVGVLAVAGAASIEATDGAEGGPAARGEADGDDGARRGAAARAYAIVNVCGALAIVIGPLMGGYAGAADLLRPLLLCIPLAVLSAAVAPSLVVLHGARARGGRVPSRMAAPYLAASLAVFLALTSLQLALVYLVADAPDVFEGAASAVVGLCLFTGGLAMILANVVLMAWDRPATGPALALAVATAALGFALAALSSSTVVLIGSLALVGLGAGVAITYSASMTTAASADPESSAMWLALSQGAGAVLGPPLGLLLYVSDGLFQGLALLMVATAAAVAAAPRRTVRPD